MKNSTSLLLCIFLFGAFPAVHAQSTVSEDPLFRHIPADASQVIDIKVTQLLFKANWTSLSDMMEHNKKINTWYGMLKDLPNSGIDLRHDLLIAKTSPTETDSATYFTILIHLADSGKFVAFLHDKHPHVHTLHMPGRGGLATMKNIAAAWNSKLAVFVIAKPPKKKSSSDTAGATPPTEGTPPATGAPHNRRHTPPTGRHTAPTGGMPHTTEAASPAARMSLAALHGFDNSFFTTDLAFKTGLADDADIHIWTRDASKGDFLKELIQKSPGGAQIGGLSEMLKNRSKAPSLSTIRFEPGKLVFRTEKLAPGPGSETAPLISGGSFGDQLTAALPSGQLLAMATLRFNLSALADSIQKNPDYDKYSPMLKGSRLTMQDIPHALKGEFLLLAYTPDNTMPGGLAGAKGPRIYLAAALGDQAAFEKIAAALKIPSGATATTDTTTDTAHHKLHLFYATQNNTAVIAGTSQQATGFFTHPATTNPTAHLLTAPMRASLFSMAIDMQTGADYLAGIMTKGDTLSAKNRQMINMIKKMDALRIYSGFTAENHSFSTVELSFTDPNKNAIANLFEIVAGLDKSGRH